MIGKTLGRYSVEATPVTDRLNHLPVTRAHIRATVIVGLGLFFDLFDVFLAGVLSTVLTASYGFNRIIRIERTSFAGNARFQFPRNVYWRDVHGRNCRSLW